jgi:hypothetical protein
MLIEKGQKNRAVHTKLFTRTKLEETNENGFDLFDKYNFGSLYYQKSYCNR